MGELLVVMGSSERPRISRISELNTLKPWGDPVQEQGVQSQSFASPRWVLSPHPSIVICNLVNRGKQGEKKRQNPRELKVAL